MKETRTILYYDGVCNLCDRTVQFVIKHDIKQQVFFAQLQNHPEVQHKSVDSVVLLNKGAFYYKSDAVLQLAKMISGIWKLVLIGYILPKFIRDGMYDFIAKRRYKWFGQKQECLLPSAALQKRFLS